jgi:hypothetical protein
MTVRGSVESLEPLGGTEGALFRTGLDRAGPSWLLEGGCVFAAAGLGLGADELAPEVLAFSLDTGARVRAWPLCVPRYSHTTVAMSNGSWLLIAGLVKAADGLAATGAVERLDLRAGTSERLPDLLFAVAEPLAAWLPGGRLLVAGGYDDEVMQQTAILDLGAPSFHLAPPLPVPRAAAAKPIALSDHHVLFAGGYSDLEGAFARDGLILDTRDLGWQIADIEVPRGAAILDLGGSRFLASGGRDPSGAPVAANTLWSLCP